MKRTIYVTEHFQEATSRALADTMSEFFMENRGIFICDVSIMFEQQINQLAPGKVVVVFVALVTYKEAYKETLDFDAN